MAVWGLAPHTAPGYASSEAGEPARSMERNEVTRMGERHLCEDCGIDTDKIGELYMVHNEIWDAVKGIVYLVYDQDGVCIGRAGEGLGMLCVSCLETRMGRELTAADFTEAPINFPYTWGRSSRLLKRLKGTRQ